MSNWNAGDLCYVTIWNKQYEGVVLEMSDISRQEHNYDLAKVELTETKTIQYKDWNDEVITKNTTRTWVHPEPVQSYNLRKRVAV
jgi:hypothetical protein